MGWPDATVGIFMTIGVMVFFSGWPTLIIHTKCNCKK